MAIKPLNSVGGFSVGEVPANIILANGDITASNATFEGNLLISNAISSWGVLTDNLYYSNGVPWDLQQAAGSNSQVQFNNNGDFGASSNFTFDTITNLLTIVGNIDTTNRVRANYIVANSNVTANNVIVSSNVEVTETVFANLISSNSNVLATGNVRANYVIANAAVWAVDVNANSAVNAVGNVLGNNLNANANVLANNFQANSNITANGNLQVSNANLGNAAIANFVSVASNTITNNLTVNLDISGNTANFTGNVTTLNANLGNLAEANFVNVSSNLDVNGSATLGSATVEDLTAYQIVFPDTNKTLTGGSDLRWVVGNASLWTTGIESNGLITTSGNLEANNANFTGNTTSLNANLGNLATANYINVANDLNVIGNVTAGNLVGTLANGNSNVKIYGNANVEVTVNGTANVATFTDTGLLVLANINATTGNITANGNLIANGFVNAANANITGEALINSVRTSNITGNGTGVTIYADGVDQNIALLPTGNGTVDVNNFRITQLGAPLNPNDATTKEYVDAISGTGLIIHTPVRVEANTALNGTYIQGGTTPTVDAIVGGKTLVFTAPHGLAVNDGIVFNNTFNGLVGGEAYWVFNVANTTALTVKDGYYGTEVTGLTSGSSLAQGSRANPGVGARLENSGANVALVIDGVTLANGDRVLVYSEANSAHNGVYNVTDNGSPSTAWVLTRSSDMDTYIPKSSVGLGVGDYFFVTEGANAAGESYVMTAPEGEVIIGTDNISFTQFNSAGSYSAGPGINITGTSISANTDGITTEVYAGNIRVKDNAQFVTPNIGAATGTSLNVTGNVTANNVSVGNVANIGLDLTVGNTITSNGNIRSNANVYGNNFSSTFDIEASANILGQNITANATVTALDANVSNLATLGNATVTNELSGNTANFSGIVNFHANIVTDLDISGNTANFTNNVIANNVTVNSEFSGNTANFSGDVNFHGNIVTDLDIQANTANFSGAVLGTTLGVTGNISIANAANGGSATNGILTDNLYYSNGQPWDMQQAAGSNNEIQFNINDDFSASANLTFDPATSVLGVIGDANISNTVVLGNTTTAWATVTTTSIVGNQTIASISVSGITGVEYLVKGVDASGSKYSVATVQAVTDGTTVDYSTYGAVYLGGTTGLLAVNISGGLLQLQVTPASMNSTVWTTQYRTI